MTPAPKAKPEVKASNASGSDNPTPKVFSGIARSLECFNNLGQFKNFRILTMKIENNVVTEIIYSDPYAQFEAQDVMELQFGNAILNLNNNWEEGRTIQK